MPLPVSTGIQLTALDDGAFDRFSDLGFGDKGHRFAANPSFRGCAELWIRGAR